jgi:hypothetical protein
MHGLAGLATARISSTKSLLWLDFSHSPARTHSHDTPNHIPLRSISSKMHMISSLTEVCCDAAPQCPPSRGKKSGKISRGGGTMVSATATVDKLFLLGELAGSRKYSSWGVCGSIQVVDSTIANWWHTLTCGCGICVFFTGVDYVIWRLYEKIV